MTEALKHATSPERRAFEDIADEVKRTDFNRDNIYNNVFKSVTIDGQTVKVIDLRSQYASVYISKKGNNDYRDFMIIERALRARSIMRHLSLGPAVSWMGFFVDLQRRQPIWEYFTSTQHSSESLLTQGVASLLPPHLI